VSAERDELARRYAGALRAALTAGGDEGALSAAYDLGRDAVRQGLSVLDLAAIHTAALVEELRETPDRAADDTARAAGDFFLESVSAYEMLARVLRQSSEVARLEQRHALLLRQLSGFLGDASLAVDANASLQEVLQLVAEHALDVVEADACAARLGPGGTEPAVLEAEALTGPSAPDPGVRERLGALYAELRPRGGPARLDVGEVAARVPDAQAAWLAAPFTALDGRVIGLLQLFSLGGDRAFSALDEAVVMQLAQMASATFERMDLYRR
jgi:Phosphoserine phosphatase RsbU, N-terminal domain